MTKVCFGNHQPYAHVALVMVGVAALFHLMNQAGGAITTAKGRSMNEKMVLWDKDTDEEAINYDGTAPVIDGGYVYIKDLGCNCDPGHPCGGCVVVTKVYELGERFVWQMKGDQ